MTHCHTSARSADDTEPQSVNPQLPPTFVQDISDRKAMENERQCEGTGDTIRAPVHVPEDPQLASSHSRNGSNSPTEASANADKMTGMDIPLPMLATGAEPLSTQSLVPPRDEVFQMVLQVHSDNPQDDKVVFQYATDVLETLQRMFRDQTSLMERSGTIATELETGTLNGAFLVGTSTYLSSAEVFTLILNHMA